LCGTIVPYEVTQAIGGATVHEPYLKLGSPLKAPLLHERIAGAQLCPNGTEAEKYPVTLAPCKTVCPLKLQFAAG
jgi:hypothetical protein